MVVRKSKNLDRLLRLVPILLASAVIVYVVPYRELVQALAQVSLVDVLWLGLI